MSWFSQRMVTWSGKIVVLVAFLLALPALAVWLGLPPEGDALDYRVALVKWIAKNGRIPDWQWTFIDDYPLLGDLLMVPLYSLHPNFMRLVPIGGYLLCGYFAGKLAQAFRGEDSKLSGKELFWIAFAWALALRPLALQANLLMVDTLAAAFTLGCLYFVLIGSGWKAGLLCALALATRYTTWASVAALFMIYLIRVFLEDKKNGMKTVVHFLALASLGALPFMIRNWLVNRNPFFPIATGLFNGYLLGVFDNYGRGKGILDFLMLPFDLLYTNSFVLGFFDYTIGKFFYLQLATFLALAVWKWRLLASWLRLSAWNARSKWAGVFLLLHLLGWFFSSQQLRFLVPGLVLVNLAILLFLAQGAPRWLLASVTLFGIFSAVSIERDSIMIALGKKESHFSELQNEAKRCFTSAGVSEHSLVAHYSRDGVIGFFNHPFIYGGRHSYLVPKEHGYELPEADFIYDPEKTSTIPGGYIAWPPDAPCLWKKSESGALNS